MARPDWRLSGTVLVVEDNLLIALDVEDALLELGADAVRVCNDVASALNALDETVTLAILDIHLGDETSAPVAEALTAHQVPFICSSGAHGDAMPDFARAVPVLVKPFSQEALEQAMLSVAA